MAVKGARGADQISVIDRTDGHAEPEGGSLLCSGWNRKRLCTGHLHDNWRVDVRWSSLVHKPLFLLSLKKAKLCIWGKPSFLRPEKKHCLQTSIQHC
jgi:hypothetical protein